MQVRRDRATPMLRGTHQSGEVTVEVDGDLVALEPVCALMVNAAEDWTDLGALVRFATEVVDPESARTDVDGELRTRVLGLVTMGVLEARDD